LDFLYSVLLLLMFSNLLIGDRFHHFETLLNSGVATAVTFWYKVSGVKLLQILFCLLSCIFRYIKLITAIGCCHVIYQIEPLRIALSYLS